MYKCKYFRIEELVDKATFQARGEKAWELLDPRLLKTLDNLRYRYDQPIRINNWLWGGAAQYRGFRPPDCTVGARLSQHRSGRAADFTIAGMTAEEVRADILKWQDTPDFWEINCIEDDVSWIHIDVRNCKRILRVKP